MLESHEQLRHTASLSSGDQPCSPALFCPRFTVGATAMQADDAPEAEPEAVDLYDSDSSEAYSSGRDSEYYPSSDDEEEEDEEEYLDPEYQAPSTNVIDLTGEDEVEILPSTQPSQAARSTAAQQTTVQGCAAPDMSDAALLKEAAKHTQVYRKVQCVTTLGRIRIERHFLADQHCWQSTPPAKIDEQREGLPAQFRGFDAEAASLEDIVEIVRSEQEKLRALGPPGEQLADHLDRIPAMA